MKPKAVVWDIDGVLADSAAYTKPFWEEALKQLGPPPRGMSDYEWFQHADCWTRYNPQECVSIPGWVKLCQMLHDSGYYTIILTARRESRRELTKVWLNRFEIPWDMLIMWDAPAEYTQGDYQNFKRDQIKSLKDLFEIELAIDDEKGHCESHRENGILFIHAHPDSHR